MVLLLAGRVALLLRPMPLLPPAAGLDLGLVGSSLAMAKLRREIEAASLLEVPVLVRGETGTGKELVSQAVHDARPRRGPYVAVNLGALVPALAASELFGATRGAYTGADRPREGYFRRADGGTLFLDEIGEAPLEVQVMLLRTLETGRVQAVGRVDEKQVDVRVIAATDADLEAAIAAGRFRSALLHRLAGYEIGCRRCASGATMRPPAAPFPRAEETAGPSAARRLPGTTPPPWPPAARPGAPRQHDWPGNVRELKTWPAGWRSCATSKARSTPGRCSTSCCGRAAAAPPSRRPPPAAAPPQQRAGRDDRPRASCSPRSKQRLAPRPRRQRARPVAAGPLPADRSPSRPAHRRRPRRPRAARRRSPQHGSVEAAARALKVSPQGLKRRL